MIIFYALIFLLLTAFFSGAEIAFITANKLSIEVKKSRGIASGKILSAFFDKPDDFISAMLVGVNMSLVVLSYLLTSILSGPLSNLDVSVGLLWIVNTFLVTIIILVFGEFLPKAFFRLYSNNLLVFFAYPLLFFYKLLYFPAKVFSSISNLIIKYVLKQTVVKTRHRFNSMDLEHYIYGPSSLRDDEMDSDIFKNALNLKQIKVKECIVPRNEIIFIDVEESIEALIEKFSESQLSRIIVIDGELDEIQGYVHSQQLFKSYTNIRDMVMEMPFVPETLNVYDLMLRMNKLRISVACVVDEFGGTSGIITFEDILEEIFGEIKDEHDLEEFIEKQISENEFIFSGRLELQYINQEFNLDIPDGEYHTLSGYLVMTSEVIPEQGAEIIQDNYKFILELVSDTRIETVRVIKLNLQNS